MRIPTTQDFERIMQSLSDTPGNNAAYQALAQLRDESRVERQPYVFEVDFATIVAGTTAPVGSFLVDSSSPFMLVAQMYQCDAAAAAKTAGTYPIPNATVQIQDQSSNRNWQNAAVPVPSIFGVDAGRPFYLPQPRLIPANTTVLVTVANYDAAQTFSLRLSFIGYRFYSTTN